jgi:hypothetical protein
LKERLAGTGHGVRNSKTQLGELVFLAQRDGDQFSLCIQVNIYDKKVRMESLPGSERWGSVLCGARYGSQAGLTITTRILLCDTSCETQQGERFYSLPSYMKIKKEKEREKKKGRKERKRKKNSGDRSLAASNTIRQFSLRDLLDLIQEKLVVQIFQCRHGRCIEARKTAFVVKLTVKPVIFLDCCVECQGQDLGFKG